ncbi:hypothetical protein E1B28_013335 [Marasmius oreades]|uniref:Uncharacterized protein n=1 Tax=Marasmius oreades TaxID=181124 RepID=A0A9P7UM04_9AGAR|nr:uncharacterized protein E1B28_013335 [Marasmius oreades]KAG7087362.1 hypothetical protein E1B28_013335 [Marasmius oreades]
MSLTTNFLFAITPPSSSSSSSMSSTRNTNPNTTSRPRRRRPKGLWKARVTFTVTEARFLNLPHPHPHPHYRPYPTDDLHRHRSSPRRIWDDHYHDADTDEDDDDGISRCSSTSTSATSFTNINDNDNKKPRLGSPVSDEENNSIFLWGDQQHHLQPFVLPSVSRARIMDISSLATAIATSSSEGIKSSTALFNYEDWEDLKDLFASAAEQYETAEPSEAIPLIRGVIHECHRFQKDYQDPSTLFANSTGSRTHSPIRTPPEDWSQKNTSPTTASSERKKCTCLELPTAFHNIFGTALFLFGNLIAQDPSLCLPGEPNSPNTYWMAALDVFETGENLPTRTHGLGACEAPEDWRMAIVWGRTLVCLADERIVRDRDKGEGEGSESASMTTSYGGTAEPEWAPDSPFSIIAQRRPPVTGRMSLRTASPNDLLKLAMDQFSRGIFHMPHPEQQAPASGSSLSQLHHFSRAKELFTIASEVLLVSEKLSGPGERRYWASWADSVFDQMKMESSSPSAVYAEKIDHARGRCCLIAGTALAEEFEEALESGEMDVLDSEDAEEAREILTEGVGFLERARRGREQEKKEKRKATLKRKRSDTEDDEYGDGSGKVASEESEDDEDDDLQDLLAEALLTLANLTGDEQKREELYARAEKESRGGLGMYP